MRANNDESSVDIDSNTQIASDAIARVKELASLMGGGSTWSFIEDNRLVPLWQYQTAFSEAMRANALRTWGSVATKCRETEDNMYRVRQPGTFFYVDHQIRQTQQHIDQGGEDRDAFCAYYHWLGTIIRDALQSCQWTSEQEVMLTRLRELRAAEPVQTTMKTHDNFIPLILHNHMRIFRQTPVDGDDCEREDPEIVLPSLGQEPCDNEIARNGNTADHVCKEKTVIHTQKTKSHGHT